MALGSSQLACTTSRPEPTERLVTWPDGWEPRAHYRFDGNVYLASSPKAARDAAELTG